ncbi:MAG: WbqC family protein [Candidatus Marinimicrobia bacterium]|nr:WbqC family protein [candidate division WOR-3 bacterium]MCK4445839.1 WbqC family protein [Candidatus Neomarinimicrobiota bacterium]
MKIAIHQPNFLPWIGYFHKISKVDRFVFFDNVQLPRGKSYCNRTKILINGRTSWLTIPILGKSAKPMIKDTKVDNSKNWKKKHLKTLELNYKNTKFFSDIFPLIINVYNIDSDYLVDFNIPLILNLSKYLTLNVNFIKSSDILLKNEISGLNKIIAILKQLSTNIYFSGSGAGSKRYIREEVFYTNGIKLEWQNFKSFEYNQLNTTEFVNGLSIIDLLFNCGKKSKEFLLRK